MEEAGEAWDWVLERPVEMRPGPVQLPHARTHVSQPPRRRRHPPRLHGGAANGRPGSRSRWDQRANESTSGCGEPGRQRSRVKLIPCAAPRLLPPSQTFRYFTHAQERPGFYTRSTGSYASGCLCGEEINSASANLCNREDLGNTEEEARERETRGEEQNKRDVSSFRFTVVVGEIWLCSYSTLRTGQEEE